MRGLAGELSSRPWPSLGWGVVAYAGFFFLILLTVFVMILGADSVWAADPGRPERHNRVGRPAACCSP